MIVVDSSVLIHFLNNYATPAVNCLHRLARQEKLLVGDIVLCEVLMGARSDLHARKLERELQQFTSVRMLDRRVATAAADNYRRLRSLGITIYKTVDLLIGTFCIVHGHTLLHADRDFDAMELHLGLKVVPTHYMVNEPMVAYG
jgi:predicted nucleic acid-binding protein